MFITIGVLMVMMAFFIYIRLDKIVIGTIQTIVRTMIGSTSWMGWSIAKTVRESENILKQSETQTFKADWRLNEQVATIEWLLDDEMVSNQLQDHVDRVTLFVSIVSRVETPSAYQNCPHQNSAIPLFLAPNIVACYISPLYSEYPKF